MSSVNERLPWWYRMEKVAQEAQTHVSSAQVAFRSLPRKPPKTINIDQPGQDVHTAMTLLYAIVYDLQCHPLTSTRFAAMSDLQQQWSKVVWPWCLTLLNNFVFDGQPTSKEGSSGQ
ncbi:hypothetical protein K435DRAFT_872135 [Dendrothele bispora CBS 962.96]|uniref:Uncharacterized protein n=1 Tax=Dendrothele bispora (strain CBS 962.96) TaxID=1314807 RepID=A0A4V4HCC3_DENBC|nr:hypothetical protein K435DRAFT_872135 [Dendrothele bispora CBS 962.96]